MSARETPMGYDVDIPGLLKNLIIKSILLVLPIRPGSSEFGQEIPLLLATSFQAPRTKAVQLH